MTPWTYSQSTGIFTGGQPAQVFRCYSGHGEGKNNPAMQEVPDIGPIPVGTYTIGPLHHSAKVGPLAMCLTPAEGTNTFGRADFLIHGDAIAAPGEASHGCIIMAHTDRLWVASSPVKTLEVIA